MPRAWHKIGAQPIVLKERRREREKEGGREGGRKGVEKGGWV